MTTTDLIKRIEALPESKRARVMRFLDSLTIEAAADDRGASSADEGLLERITRRADDLYAAHGSLDDSTTAIRELRDHRR